MRKEIKPPQPLLLLLLLGSFLLIAGCGYSTGVYRTVPYRPYAAYSGHVNYYGPAYYPYYRGGYGYPYRYSYGGRYISYRRHGHIGHYGYHSQQHQGHDGGQHYGYHHGHSSHGH